MICATTLSHGYRKRQGTGATTAISGGSKVSKVYISGPITKGNKSHNFHQACEAQRLLMLGGYSVLNPMLSMMHPDGINIPWETWIASDLLWVASADCVVRLPGESKGADLECDHARERGIPVYPPRMFSCLRELFPEYAQDEMEQEVVRSDPDWAR